MVKEVQKAIYCKRDDKDIEICPAQDEAMKEEIEYKNPCSGCESALYGTTEHCYDACVILTSAQEEYEYLKNQVFKEKYTEDCKGCILGPNKDDNPKYKITQEEPTI